MGRAARNHGGTGGHGYFPLPGERPNYNHHVIQDNVLFNTVKNNVKKQGESTKLSIVKQRLKEEMLSTRQSAHCQKETFSLDRPSDKDNLSVKSKEAQGDPSMKNQMLDSTTKSKKRIPDKKESHKAKSTNGEQFQKSGKDIDDSSKQDDSETFLKQPVGLAVAQPREVSKHLQVNASPSTGDHKCALPDRGSVGFPIQSPDSRLSPEAPEFKSKETQNVQPTEREASVNQPACLSLAHPKQKPEISLENSGLSFLQPSILEKMPVSNLSLDLQQFLPITQMPLHYLPTYMLTNGTYPGNL